MEPRHARYPFFETAREAVEAADIALPSLVAANAPAVERGVERVRRALMEGTVAPAEPGRWEPRTELLSYPLARVLVSLVANPSSDGSGLGAGAESGTPAAVGKYAEAEAATARGRFAEDFDAGDDELRSTGADRRLSLEEFLREFDLAADVTAEAPAAEAGTTAPGGNPRRFRVAVSPYLQLSDPGWDDGWRLVNRELADGAVRVGREELYRLLQAAVRERVAEGLPFAVRRSASGDRLAESLADEVAELRDLLADRKAVREVEVDAVVPGLFPPCMRALLDRARSGDDLAPHSRFALVSFLVGLDMSAGEIRRLVGGGLDEEALDAQVTYLEDGDGTQYAPPSCATMDAYGDCVNPDERCETISHPMTYYATALADADDVGDWRGRGVAGDEGDNGDAESGV